MNDYATRNHESKHCRVWLLLGPEVTLAASPDTVFSTANVGVEITGGFARHYRWSAVHAAGVSE